MAATKKSNNKKKLTRKKAAKTISSKEPPVVAELRQQLAQALQQRTQALSDTARLTEELQDYKRQLIQAVEQQTGTGEILRVISSSPTNLQPVFDTILANATRLCEATLAALFLFDGEVLTAAAHHNASPAFAEHLRRLRAAPSRDRVIGLAMLQREAIHVTDVLTDPRFSPASLPLYQQEGARTVLAVPMLRENELAGGILIWRTEARPFSDKQIALLKTFADQAVIAIENVRLFQELKGSLEQQTATSEILGVIASSPTDIQPVLSAVAENAVRLCAAEDASIRLAEGNLLRFGAHYGTIPMTGAEHDRPINRLSVMGRAVVDRQRVHVEDLQAAHAEGEFLGARIANRVIHTMLAMPLMREGVAIGVIGLRRTEIQPFTERQISLLKTFADQAVIAIENVRLFKELQERNAELREALEHQTATSEVLGIISRSPTDVQPVLDAIVESAAQVCGIDDVALRLRDANVMVVRSHFGPIRIGRGDMSIDEPRFSWMREHGTLHIPDRREQNIIPPVGSVSEWRTWLGVPLRQQGEFIGSLIARRTEARPFTPAQIKLMETFGEQAVIALQNVRLFQELKESLEQQTATSEILGVIASSPTNIQPVLDAVIANAVKLSGAEQGHIRQYDGEFLRVVAHCNETPEQIEQHRARPTRPNLRGTSGRAFLQRSTVHILDAASEFGPTSLASQASARTILCVPLLREGTAIGTISIWRDFVRAFDDEQIQRVTTFADQAVIAIENVRLFKELQQRNAELREALEHQTATSEVLGIISRSPTYVQPVLDAIVESAAKVCGIDDIVLRLREGDIMDARAHFGSLPITRLQISVDEPYLDWMHEHGTLHIPDVTLHTEVPLVKHSGNWRTVLYVPLRQRDEVIGHLTARRIQFSPFSQAQIKLLETFADQAVIAIENVRLFQELQQRTSELARSVGELKALGEVGQAVSSTLDLEKVLATIVAHAVELSGTACGVIYEYEEDTQKFHLRASHRMEEEVVDALRTAPIRLGEGATGHAATNRAPIQVPDILAEREYTGTRVRPMLIRLGYRSLLSIPLLREQQIMGGLTVWRRQSGNFEPEIVNLLQTFATQSALAIQNARLFREIENKSREIEAANRHKSEFLANMSHELRTPLTAIIGFSEVLSDKIFGELNGKQDEYIGDIVSSGRHLLSLINDILDLSKVEAGRMDLDLAKFDLAMAIENALILIRERATRHGIKVAHKLDERLGEIVADERKFKQILLNLLSNAVKFTPEGGRIDVAAALMKDFVEISISDTGIGIALKHQETIFEEFRQVATDASKKREGTGLGLTLTKKFVELHGGSIRLESILGKGSTFTFTLPLNHENVDVAGINPDR